MVCNTSGCHGAFFVCRCHQLVRLGMGEHLDKQSNLGGGIWHCTGRDSDRTNRVCVSQVGCWVD